MVYVTLSKWTEQLVLPIGEQTDELVPSKNLVTQFTHQVDSVHRQGRRVTMRIGKHAISNFCDSEETAKNYFERIEQFRTKKFDHIWI